MGILDDGYDPLDRIGRIPGLDGGGGSPRPIYRHPLPPDQLKSVGQKALDTGASGLSYVLGTLDKPGQAARGVLAGHGVAALKHLVPFSDSMGLTTEADHVSGRDLTDQYGLTSKHDKGWGAWGAGLAADIATDPLTYTTFGAKHALTPIGAAVQKTGALKGWKGAELLKGFNGVEPAMLKAGQTASDVTHAIDQGKRIATGAAAATGVNADQPLSSLVRFGLPFGGPGVNIGTGARSQAIAGAMDSAGDYLKFGNPVGRAVGSLFDSTRHGAVDRITQEGAQKYLDPSLHALQAQARNDRGVVIKALDPLVSSGAHPEHMVTDAARAVAEGVTHPFDPALVAQVRPVGDQIRDIGKRQLGEARQAGAPLKEQGDAYRDYVHRSATTENPHSLQVGQRSKNMLPVTSGADIAVDPLYRDIPGATHRINDWFGRFAGDADKTKVSQAVLKDLFNDFNHTGNPLTKAISDGFDSKAVAMAERLAASSPSRLATPTSRGGLFTPDTVSDVTQRGAQHAKTVSNVHGAIGIIGDNARPIVPGDGMVPVTALLKKLGLATTKADHAAGTPMEGALVQAYKALAKQGAGKVDPFLMGKRNTLAKAVGGYGLTPEHADQITKAYGRWSAPEQIKSSLGALDSFTNAFKGLAYPIWIPAHVRNAGTAAVNNATRGVGLGDYLDQLQVMTGRGSRDLSRVHPSLAGLNPADQVDKLRELQYGGANIFGGHGMNEEIAGNVNQALKDGKRFTPQVPGSDRVGPTGNLAGDTANLVLKEGVLGSLGSGLRTVRDSVGGLLDPSRRWGQSLGENLGIRGVGGATADTLPAVKAGRKAGTNIEDFFRGAQFNRELRTGATTEVAADSINRLHFDYDALTGFEKNVMRRAVPFYCVPVDHEILTQQGWKTYDKLSIGEPVLSYDHDSGELSWHPLEDVATFDYDGELWTIDRSKSKHNFEFTPDHRWPVITTKSFTKGKWYGGYHKVVRSNEMNTGHTIPLTANFRGTESILSPRHAAILGWVITDGYHRWRGNYCEMVIYQSPEKHLSEIEKLTCLLARAPHPDTGVCAVPVLKEDVKSITAYYRDDDDLPEIVGNLSREAADAMWDAMFKAEGWTVPETAQQGFAQDPELNPKVLEAFQVLSLLTGRSANLNGRGAYIGKPGRTLKVSEGIGRKYYKGKIWCPKTKHGCWVMRHNGATVLTGNTFMKKNLPLQLDTAIHTPGVINAQYKPFHQEGPGEKGYVPQYLNSGVAIPLGPEQDGKRQYLSKLGLPAEEAFERLHFKNGLPDIRSTALDYMGSMNPIIKAPLEQIFDTQFHTGRKLSDLKVQGAAKSIGQAFGEDNPQFLGQVMANSPFTRFFSSADKLTDPRKTLGQKLLNLGTGLRVSDVDTAKQRAIDTRTALEGIMKGHPNLSRYSSFYVKPEDAKDLSPEEIEMMRAYSAIQANAKAYAEQNRRIGIQR